MIFVDSSAFIPLVVKTDEFHQEALTWWNLNLGISLVTSNLVVMETLGWLRYKSGKNIAVKTGKNLLIGGDIKIEKATREDEKKAWKLFQKLGGRGVSMIDCTSFALMKRLKIKDAFAFDRDFRKMGFNVYP